MDVDEGDAESREEEERDNGENQDHGTDELKEVHGDVEDVEGQLIVDLGWRRK